MREIILYILLIFGCISVVWGVHELIGMKLKSIFTGWWYYAFSSVEVERMAKIRSKYCQGCVHNKESLIDIITDKKIPSISKRHCEECGCPLSTKLRSKFEECPIGLWHELKTKQ